MTHSVACFRCGASLASLSLPLSRREECPDCSAHLHVCKMCRHFDVAVPTQCREDGAEEVTYKDRQNFCDWFVPSEDAFDPAGKDQADKAQQELDVLFGDAEASGDVTDAALSDAEKLFD